MIIAGTQKGLFDTASATPLDDRSVTDLVVAGDSWWGLLEERTIVRNGEEVAEVTSGPAWCLRPVDADMLVGTAGAHLLRLRDTILSPVDSFDEIPGREAWYTPWGAPPDTRSLAAAGDDLFVNVHVGGVWRSPDSGGTWLEAVDVEADTHQVVAEPDRVAVAAAIGYGESRDRGETWTWTTDGLHATYSRALAFAGETVLLSASTGPSSRRAAVYRRSPGESAFSKCVDGLPEWFDANVNTGCIAASGNTAVIGTEAGAVYRSDDAGGTWTQVAGDLPHVRCIALLDA